MWKPIGIQFAFINCFIWKNVFLHIRHVQFQGAVKAEGLPDKENPGPRPLPRISSVESCTLTHTHACRVCEHCGCLVAGFCCIKSKKKPVCREVLVASTLKTPPWRYYNTDRGPCSTHPFFGIRVGSITNNIIIIHRFRSHYAHSACYL